MQLPISHTTVPPSQNLNVPYVGVGEQPGREDVKRRQVFVGPAGKELDDCLSSANLSRPMMYLTNVIKDLDKPIEAYIQLYKNSKPLSEPIISPKGKEYIEFLKWELSKTSAEYILAIGGVSLYILTERIGITKWRGSLLDCSLIPGRKVIPTIHPATIIPPKNNFLNKRLLIFDLKRLKSYSEGLIVPTDRVYEISPSYETVIRFLNFCYEKGLAGSRISYDIEVFMDRKYKQISCIAFAVDLQAICIPFTDQHGDYFTISQEADIWILITKILEDPMVKICGQNLTFDNHFLLRTYGIRITNIDDTMVAQQLLMADYSKGLDFITSLWTDHPYYKADGKAFFAGSGQYQKFWRYNATDALICDEAFPKQREELVNMDILDTYDNQISLIEPLVYMMEKGIRVDVAGMENAAQEHEKQLRVAQDELDTLAGRSLNAKSPKQLNDYFFIEKGVTPYKAKGKTTYNDLAMKRLIRKGWAEAKLIQKIRKFTKLKSTYLDVAKIDADKRLRCSYNPVGTRYSRISSSKNIWGSGTNLQNFPHHIQDFLIPDPGYVYYAFDLSQAENRIVAYVGDILEMIQCFETGEDVHSKSARMIMKTFYGAGYDSDKISVRDMAPIGDGNQEWRFWGKKCVSGETEVLTPKGWIRIDRWDFKQMPIAQWNHDREITFVMATELNTYITDDIIELSGKNVHVRGTPNHRIPIHRHDKGIKKETTLAKVMPDIHFGIPISGMLKNDRTFLNHFETMLLVAFQADGSYYNKKTNYYRFGLKKNRKINRLIFILDNLHTSYDMSKQKDGSWNITFKYSLKLTKDFDSFLLKLGVHEMRTFIDEVTKWDGYEGDNRKQYFTTNYNNAEWVQTIAHLVGYLGTLSIRLTDETRKTLYIVNLNNRTQNANLSTTHKRLWKRKTQVYGPTVPSGFFLIRSDNKISVTGNSNHGFNYDWSFRNFALVNEIPEKDGKLIYNAYHSLYPGVQQSFHTYVRRSLRTTRMLKNLMGRKTMFLGPLTGRNADKTFKEAYSCIPQGTVGDIINKQGINYIYYNQDLFAPVELLRQIHDEIDFQIPLSAGWEDHARMLRLIKESLEIPLTTHNGRTFTIPADLTMGISLNKDNKKTSISIDFLGNLENNLKDTWEKISNV